MIDPVHSLAFSIQANPGVYAVLVGSGVSRAAKVPTGWEITLDLIRKLAKLCDETCDPRPGTLVSGEIQKRGVLLRPSRRTCQDAGRATTVTPRIF